MAKRENEFPTIRNARAALAKLIEDGLGDLPVQLLVVPDSTLQAIAGAMGYRGSHALMIDLISQPPTSRLPFALISTERLGAGNGMPSKNVQ